MSCPRCQLSYSSVMIPENKPGRERRDNGPRAWPLRLAQVCLLPEQVCTALNRLWSAALALALRRASDLPCGDHHLSCCGQKQDSPGPAPPTSMVR